MSPALIRSATLSLAQVVALAACSTAPETQYHLVPEPSRGAMIAVAPASASASTSASKALRTSLSVDDQSIGGNAFRFGAGT